VNIHKGKADIVLVDLAGLGAAHEDFAEDAKALLVPESGNAVGFRLLISKIHGLFDFAD
jgi:hypothetical protein